MPTCLSSNNAHISKMKGLALTLEDILNSIGKKTSGNDPHASLTS